MGYDYQYCLTGLWKAFKETGIHSRDVAIITCPTPRLGVTYTNLQNTKP